MNHSLLHMRLVIASILNFDINFLKSAGIERNKVYKKILGIC